MTDPRRVGVTDDSFQIKTVGELVEDGILDRPMDGNHGEQHPKAADYVPDGIPFVMANDLVAGRVNYDACHFISKKQADGLRKGFARQGDVLLTHKATIGRTALVGPEADPYIMLTPQVTYYRVNDQGVLSNHYLRHYFDSELFQKTLALWADAGATRAYLGITAQLKLPVILPPIRVQHKIAAVLTAYDDLIDANKRRIALLEEMAEELYREWFVRMRFPGHQNTKFVKGVPEGWEITRLGEILELAYGKALKESDREPGEFHVYGSGGIVGSHSRALVENEGIIVGRKGNVGAVHFSDRGFFPIDTVFYVVSELPLTFLFFLLQMMNFINNDAAVPGLNRNQAYSNQLFYPGSNLIIKFAEMVDPIFDMKHQLQAQNENLIQTRDLLLPRLISGKLAVEDLDIEFPLSMREEANAPEPAYA